MIGYVFATLAFLGFAVHLGIGWRGGAATRFGRSLAAARKGQEALAKLDSRLPIPQEAAALPASL